MKCKNCGNESPTERAWCDHKDCRQDDPTDDWSDRDFRKLKKETK